jgi:hypothetical protein
MRYEFWAQRPSGELAAVMLDDGGRVVGACSPISQRDLREQPDPSEYNFDLVGADAEWFNEHEGEFALVRPEA